MIILLSAEGPPGVCYAATTKWLKIIQFCCTTLSKGNLPDPFEYRTVIIKRPEKIIALIQTQDVFSAARLEHDDR
jgi:hypothetical protein